MAQAKKGDRVAINFTGTLEDGTVFDTTFADDDCSSDECGTDDCGCETGPMELIIGEEEFFPLVEEALIGMAPGEKKTVVIPSEEAFGEYDEEQVFSIKRSEVPDHIHPEEGQELELTGEDDESVIVTVVEVTGEEITLDANHPLAGEDLSFEVELVEIL
jgi:peptidylprolyl isomerase